MIVTTDAIKMNMEKTEAIQNWKTLTSVKKIQVFMEFANFYCCFIFDFF